LKDILFWGPILLLFVVTFIFVVYPAYENYLEKKEQEKALKSNKQSTVSLVSRGYSRIEIVS